MSAQGPALDVARGDVVVIVLLESRHDGDRSERQRLALELLGRHTPLDTEMLALDLAGTRADRQLRAGDRELPVVSDHAARPGAAIASALHAAAPADVLVVSSQTLVGAGWLWGLRAAAGSDSTVASASAITDGEGAIGLADSSLGVDLERQAAAVRAWGQQERPRIASARPHCVYLCRDALQLARGVDAGAEDWPPALAALSRSCSDAGLVHVLADDVLVAGGPSLDLSLDDPSLDAALLIERDDQPGPVRRALRNAGVATRGLSVTIDGRALASVAGGTQVYIVELALALARTDELALRVVVPPDLAPDARAALADVENVSLLAYEDVVDGVARTDVVHRPQQVFDPTDFTLLRLLGDRIVVTHQDLIAYRIPRYHATPEVWRRYRRSTRLALGLADRVVFFSEHARSDAVREELINDDRSAVIGIGSQPLWQPPDDLPRRPDAIADGEPFILCLGADYQHKNRVFALQLLAEMRRAHGWSGRLVLAGAHVAHGSSADAERRLLEADRELAASVVDLGPVDGPAKSWLYGNARATLCPSVIEGFGLIPLESARAGVPCLYAAVASLPEVAGSEAATLVAWDVVASAAAAAPLLADGPARDAHLSSLVAHVAQHSWARVAADTIEAYRACVRSPARTATPRLWQDLDRESTLEHSQREWLHVRAVAEDYQHGNRVLKAQYDELVAKIGDRLPLVEEGGLLTPNEAHGLMRVAARHPIHGLVLWPFAALGRLGGDSE